MDDDLNDWLDDSDDVVAVHTIIAVRQSADFVEWKCPTCGRHVQVAHAGGLTVLDSGDSRAVHRGSVGVHLAGSATATQPRTPPPTIH